MITAVKEPEKSLDINILEDSWKTWKTMFLKGEIRTNRFMLDDDLLDARKNRRSYRSPV